MKKLVIAIAFAASFAHADVVRLQAKYTETTYNVHPLTGLTSNERHKDKLKFCPVEIKKTKLDGVPVITFEKKKASHDTEDAGALGGVPYEQKGELLKALIDAKSKMSKPAKEDETETVFEGTDLSFILDLGKTSSMSLKLGDWSFLLAAPHVQQIIDALKHQ